MYLNTESVKTHTYDAIVVGSGISGGWAAKELCEKGLKVLLLERGRDQKHIKDYKNATTPVWELPHHNRITKELKEKFPYMTVEGNYPLNEANQDFWMPYAESPYQQDKPFYWFRGNGIGGKSLLWGRQVYRWGDLDFEANEKEGVAVDWPIRYKDIEPWYDYVEKFIGVSGEKLGLPHVPDGIFQPAMDMNCVERDFREKIKTHYSENRHITMGRVAHLTQPEAFQLELGRASCQYRNACSNGCPYGAYFSTQAATLPAALRTGNLTVRPFSVVSKVIYDTAGKKATGVEVIDAQTLEAIEYKARIIFLNASTIGTTHILLNSTSSRFPEGLGNDSGQLGRNLMDHHSRAGASGVAEGFEDKFYYGRRANGIFIPRYRNIGKDKRDYLRGFDYQGGASRQGWHRMIAEHSFGEGFKNEVSKPGPWTIGLGAFGECLPYEDNRMTLHPLQRDKFGMPSVVFNAEIRENEFRMRKDMANDAAEMLEAAGFTKVKSNDSKKFALGLSKHEMGTARMGRSPKTSVLNGHNQLWDCKNVFVTDGACMTSSGCVNPSLTYMALTARACDFAVEEMKKLNL